MPLNAVADDVIILKVPSVAIQASTGHHRFSVDCNLTTRFP